MREVGLLLTTDAVLARCPEHPGDGRGSRRTERGVTRPEDLPREELLRALTEAAARAVRAERIVRFGPWARGTAAPGDPVDLLIVTAEPLGGGPGRTHVAVQLWRALAEFRVPKRILVFTPAETAWWQDSPSHPVGQVLGAGSSGPDLEGGRLLLAMAAKHLKAVHGMADSDLFDDEIFGFHCHGAAAGALRAWLALLGANPWLAVDDLGELLAALGERTELSPSLADLVALKAARSPSFAAAPGVETRVFPPSDFRRRRAG